MDPSEEKKIEEEVGESGLVINWIRHAESCANYDSNNFGDEIPTDYYNKSNIEFDERKDVPESYKQQTKFSLLLPSGLKAVWKYQPNLSFIGMQQAIQLGPKFINNKGKFDAVFVSATVRAIMTAMLGFRSSDTIIYVVPFISEHTNPVELVVQIIKIDQ